MGDDYSVKSVVKDLNGCSVKFNLHIPIREWLRGREVTDWINSAGAGVHVPLKISDAEMMWNLYSRVSENPKRMVEYNERKCFSKKCFLVAKLKNKVVGGLWVEEFDGSDIMHVFSHPDFRGVGIAGELEKLMLENNLVTNDFVMCNWKVERDTGQKNFFEKLGYTVSCLGDSYSAVKHVKK
ncbi:hypothetical protein COS83_00755 [archaeon CG07_land_8_20_14_0_80_38_8]|nr:MAG: hypothetical protein COS83_00755 [archaeon CG07_land_8_20_14_0_80_38_8]